MSINRKFEHEFANTEIGEIAMLLAGLTRQQLIATITEITMECAPDIPVKGRIGQEHARAMIKAFCAGAYCATKYEGKEDGEPTRRI